MVGLVRRWAAVESWAGAAKLGVIRELIRREDKPWRPTDQHTDMPDAWSESLTHELALALASSAGSADRMSWLAWELGTRLPGIDALLTDGTLTYGKAKAVAEAFAHLTDVDAAHAEALIIGQLAGKTYLQVLRLAAMAASRVDPEGDARRRKDAEQQAARVRLWREQSGAAALAGFDLPTDEALAAHANVSARAEQYKASEAFPGAKLDQLRAMGYLDLLNGIPVQARIARALARARPDNGACEDGGAHADDGGHEDQGGQEDTDGPGGNSDAGGPGGGGPDRDGDSGGTGPGGTGPGGGGPGGTGPGGGGPGGGDANAEAADGSAAGSSPDGRQHVDQPGRLNPAARKTDLIIPLATLLGLGNRPGEAHGFGTLDPSLCRELAVIAANSPATEFCVTVTDLDGIAVGHGCARALRLAGQQQSRGRQTAPRVQRAEKAEKAGNAELPARLQLTISQADLHRLASGGGPGRNNRPPGQGSPWAFTQQTGDQGPPGGYGTWTLTAPGGTLEGRTLEGRAFTVRLEPVPTFACDHAHESRAYQANATLRHLVQVRDGDCTFPPCTRHAREADFEHAVPYHLGGRTCGCNAGARSRRCHRVKQSAGWAVTQPQPGFHQWTTPAGRTYTQEPKRYPV